MLRLILAATFVLASLATCVIATASDCPSCRFERERTLTVKRGGRAIIDRSKTVVRTVGKKARGAARWAVRR